MGRSRRESKPAPKQNGNGPQAPNGELGGEVEQQVADVVQAGTQGGGLLAAQSLLDEKRNGKRRLSLGGGSATIPTNAPRGGSTTRGGIKIGGS